MMIVLRPGQFFTWPELTRTSTRLVNVPNAAEQAALVALCAAVLDPLRRVVGPLFVGSAYRCQAVNAATAGSSATSDHLHGCAADVSHGALTSRQLLDALIALGADFDQAIWYALERGGHLHVSYRLGTRNRREILHAPAGGGYQ